MVHRFSTLWPLDTMVIEYPSAQARSQLRKNELIMTVRYALSCVFSITNYTAFGVSLEGRTWSRTTTPTIEMYRALEPGEHITITVDGTTHLKDDIPSYFE